MHPREPETIDVPATAHVGNGALVPHEPARAIATRSANPLDMPKAQFAKALQRRGENRQALLEWVRGNLKDGTDYGKIHTTKREKCHHGGPPHCTPKLEPYHWSKDSLRKPGAEKICGMLGLIPVFPTLPEYEKLALTGVEVKTIILRCHLMGPDGQVVSDGIGGRSVAHDYGDVNKAMKMAAKSAHIDATLRAGGLSEIFTQDLEDMQALEDAQRDAGGGESTSSSTSNGHGAPAVKAPDDVFGFGKAHRETKIADLPPDYIRWVLEESNMNESAKAICRAERERRETAQHAFEQLPLEEQREQKTAQKSARLEKRMAGQPGPWTGEELVPGTVRDRRISLQPWHTVEARMLAWLAQNSNSDKVRAQAAKEIERRDFNRQNEEIPFDAPAKKQPERTGAESDFDDPIPF